MTDEGSGKRRRSLGRTMALAATAIAMVSAAAGLAYFAGPARRAPAPVPVEAALPAPAIDAAPSHMARPDPYRLYVVYFEEHQVDDSMNQDALAAIKLAADDVKQSGQSLVVTCHGSDAIPGNPKATERDFSLARFVTIRDDLIAQGLDAHRIKNEWNDPALTAAAAKEGPKSTLERPNCYLETAVPTSLD